MPNDGEVQTIRFTNRDKEAKDILKTYWREEDDEESKVELKEDIQRINHFLEKADDLSKKEIIRSIGYDVN